VTTKGQIIGEPRSARVASPTVLSEPSPTIPAPTMEADPRSDVADGSFTISAGSAVKDA
jgi:hypothetical protein